MVVYVRENLHTSVRSDLALEDIEAIWIELKRPKCKPMIIGTIYRPPDKDVDQIIAAMDCVTNVIDMSKTEFAILGDFNIDFGPQKDKRLRKTLLTFLVANDLKQLVTKPTRVCESSQTIIDLICVNNEHRVVQWEVINMGISDHSIVLCVYRLVRMKHVLTRTTGKKPL